MFIGTFAFVKTIKILYRSMEMNNMIFIHRKFLYGFVIVLHNEVVIMKCM